MRDWLGCLLSILPLAGACAPRHPETPVAAPKPAHGPSGEPRLQDRGWGVLRAPELGLKLALPEAKSWLEPAGRTPNDSDFELRHEPTGSTLSIHRWRASRLPRVDACEAELRQRTPNLAQADETNLVAERRVHVPEGFVTRITLLSLPGKTTRLEGQVLAVGAGIGQCLAAVAHTECSSEDELAERLHLLDVALGHLRLTQVEDRIPRVARPDLN